MNKKIKTCKNPDCNLEYTHYKSAKSEYCCTTCTQRGGYLRRKARNKYFHEKDRELKEQYEIVAFLYKHVKKPIPTKLLDLFNLKFEYFEQSLDINERPMYTLYNKIIACDLNDPNYVNIITNLNSPKK